MSIKKSLKKSVVLGALMSFVITGNAYAAVNTGIGWLDTMINSSPELTAAVEKVIESGVADRIEDAVAKALKDYEGGLTADQKAELEKKFNTEITGLKNQISDLTAQLGVNKEKLDAAVADAAAKAEEITNLTGQLNISQQKLNDALADAAAKAEEIAQLEADLAAGVITKEDYEQKLATAKAEAEAKAKEIAELAASNEATQKLLDDAKAAAEAKAKEIAELTEKYNLSTEALNKQITDLNKQLDQYKELTEVLGGGDLSTTLKNLQEVKDDLHKVASLAGTVEDTIKKATEKAAQYEKLAMENAALVKDKLADYETALTKNINYTEKVLTKKLNDVESKLNTYEDFVAGKLGDVENKLNQYEDTIVGQLGAIDKNIGALEDQVKENVNTLENVVKTELKEQAAALKDVQENTAEILKNTTDITHDGKETTTIKNNLVVGKDLTVNGDATFKGDVAMDKNLTVGGNLAVTNGATIGTDLTVGNSIVVADKVTIDANGVAVGEGADVSVGDIKLSTLGNVADLNEAVKAETVVGAINKENARAEAAEKVLQDNIDAEAKLREQGDAETLASAKEYTNEQVAAEAKLREQGDAATLESAKGYTNDKVAAEATARETADTALQGQITTNRQDIIGLNQRLGQLNGRVNKVGAGAAALAALHPLEYDPEDKLTFSAGMGNYAGQNAAALGAFYRPNEKLMFSLGGTMGNGENMVNLGVSIGLDGATGLAKMSKTELIQKVNAMEAEMAELRALVVKLAADKK